MKEKYIIQFHQGNDNNVLNFTIGLIELLDSAKSFIPKEYWKTTPITLKATAGLRLLPKEEGDAILEVARVVSNLYDEIMNL